MLRFPLIKTDLLDVDPDAGPGAVVEDDEEVCADPGEDAHLQLVQEPNKEAHKAGQQVSLCIKTPMQKMHKNSLLTVSMSSVL